MPTIAHAIKQVTQRAKCSNCGTVCQLQVEQWTNSLEIQQLQLPNLRCSHCGHPWNDLPGPYADLLRDAYWAPQHYWSTAGAAEKQNLARGISLEHQAELSGYLDDLQAALMLRYARTLDTTSGSAFRAISSTADEEKFRTLDEHLRLWTAELLAMQRALISELEQMWHSYSIPVSDRDWVPKASDIIWKPLENASVRWIIEALGVSADATMWIAPKWLYYGPLEAVSIGSDDGWEATKGLLRCLCDRVERGLSLERELAFNDARRAARLASPVPRGEKQPEGPEQTIDEPEKQIERLLQLPLPQSKPVREGKTVAVLYDQLKCVRKLYRNNGWTTSQLRDRTRGFLVWEWVDRIPAPERQIFLNVQEWDDGDKFIYLQIVTLYRHAGHLRKEPSWATVRDWRKAYRQTQKNLSAKPAL
jgi:hypothetical protein